MKSLLTDPVVLICSGIIIVGFFGLIWAIGKFRRMKSPSRARDTLESALTPAPDFRGMDLGLSAMPSMPVVPSAPAVGKDVSDRLESMTQRLAEMQAVLAKQSSAAADAGAMGQGFSPETIDKLLKIIGNVMQQVDILQKSLSPSKENPGTQVESSVTNV